MYGAAPQKERELARGKEGERNSSVLPIRVFASPDLIVKHCECDDKIKKKAGEGL